MLKEQKELLAKLLIVLDFIVVACALAISFTFHLNDYNIFHVLSHDFEYFSYIFAALIWIGVLKYYGCYNSNRTTPWTTIISQVSKSVLVATFIFTVGLFIFNSELLNYKFVLLIFVSTLLSLLVERLLMLLFLHAIRRKGYNYRQVLIVGAGIRAKKFAELIAFHKEWGIRCIGFVDEEKKKGETIVDGIEVIGSFDDFGDILCNQVVDEVVFCLPRSWLDRIEKYVKLCEILGVKVYITLDFFNISIAKSRLTDFGELPLLCLDSTPAHIFSLFIKRVIDIVISVAFIILLSPIFLLTPLLIMLVSPGSPIFCQERCGLNGRRFKMWKFRTMAPNADQLKAKLESLNEMSGPVFKITNDPRLIPYGKLLRKFSLDELPQLFNVLKGDMSIVGPRPPVPKEVIKYDRWQRRRLSLRPGLTCLWQVSGRNKVSFEEWVKLDLEYIDHWSLWLDIKIMLKTIPAIVGGTGV